MGRFTSARWILILQKYIPKTCKNFKELTIAYSEIPCEDVHGKGIVATPCKQTGTDDRTFAPKTCVDNATKAECDRANKRKDLLTGTWEPLQLQKCVWEGSTCRPFQCSQYSNIYKKGRRCRVDVQRRRSLRVQQCYVPGQTLRSVACLWARFGPTNMFGAWVQMGQDTGRLRLSHTARGNADAEGRKGNLRSTAFSVSKD